MRLASAVGLALVVAACGPLRAQSAREGFWMSLGLGYGSAGLDCNDCTDQREDGSGFYLRLGGSPTPRMRIGADINAWHRSRNRTEVTFASVIGLLQLYPAERAGLFLNLGAGVTTATFEFPIVDVENKGVGVELGGGWDIGIGARFAITPFALYVNAFGGGRTRFNNVEIDEEINPDYLLFGLGFTWH